MKGEPAMSTIPKGYSAFLVMLLLVCTVLFASCGGGSGTSASMPTPTPTPSPTIQVGPHPTIVLDGVYGAVSVHSNGTNNMVTIQFAQQSSSPIPYQRGGTGN